MYTVLIPHDVAEAGKAYLRQKGYEVRLGQGTDKASIMADIVDADAVLIRNQAYDADILEAGKHLKVVSRHGVGLDKVDLRKAEELGIWVTNGPLSNANSVAEMTMAFILALARNLVQHNKAVHSNDFDFRNRSIATDLEGKTLALLGFGKIAQLVAQKAHFGFGMKVVSYTPHKKSSDFPDYVQRLESFDDAFRLGDFVSAHYPGGGANNKSITKAQFALMKQGSYFVNVARGELVVEEDLVAALESGKLKGAALDVLSQEPPLPDNPLLQMEQVLLSPHVAALTSDCMARMALHAAIGIDEVLSGKLPTWPGNHPLIPRMQCT